jgi:hypothetical protein
MRRVFCLALPTPVHPRRPRRRFRWWRASSTWTACARSRSSHSGKLLIQIGPLLTELGDGSPETIDADAPAP